MRFPPTLLAITLSFACNRGAATDTDGGGDTEQEENLAPVAVDDLATLFAGGSVLIDVTDNDDDPENDTLKIAEITQGTHGVAAIDNERNVEYTTLDDGYVGVDSLTYTIYDEGGSTDSATVTVAITTRPTLTITAPVDDDVITDGTMSVTFAVTGCNFTSPSADSGGCHAHKYFDGSSWSDENGENFGTYTVAPFDIYPLTEGEHTFTLSMVTNVTDTLFDPRIEDTVTFTVDLPDAP